MPNEPRYATEEWRWIDSDDGHHKLVAGPEPLPVPRVVLECSNIDAEDADGIRAFPKLYRALSSLLAWSIDSDADVDEWDERVAEAYAALAKARGEVEPDA